MFHVVFLNFFAVFLKKFQRSKMGWANAFLRVLLVWLLQVIQVSNLLRSINESTNKNPSGKLKEGITEKKLPKNPDKTPVTHVFLPQFPIKFCCSQLPQKKTTTTTPSSKHIKPTESPRTTFFTVWKHPPCSVVGLDGVWARLRWVDVGYQIHSSHHGSGIWVNLQDELPEQKLGQFSF